MHDSLNTDCPRLALVWTLLLALFLATMPTAFAEVSVKMEETLFFESRDEIPLPFRWDVSAIFADESAWEQAIAELDKSSQEIEKFRGRLGESAETLAAALDSSFEMQRHFEDIFVYAHQILNTDTADPKANELAGRARSIAGKLQELASFIEPEIAQLPQERLDAFLEASELQPYAHYIDNIVRTREHILTPEVEKVIAGSSVSGSAHQQAFSSLVNAGIKWPTIEDEKGEELQVVPGQYMRIATSDDRRLRRDVCRKGDQKAETQHQEGADGSDPVQ